MGVVLRSLTMDAWAVEVTALPGPAGPGFETDVWVFEYENPLTAQAGGDQSADILWQIRC